jgi:hypothetical protein
MTDVAILHHSVTRYPNGFWIELQLRESWGYDLQQNFLIFDRDAKFSSDVGNEIISMPRLGGLHHATRSRPDLSKQIGSVCMIPARAAGQLYAWTAT